MKSKNRKKKQVKSWWPTSYLRNRATASINANQGTSFLERAARN